MRMGSVPPGTAGALGLFYSLNPPTDLGSACWVPPFLHFFFPSLGNGPELQWGGGGGGVAACGARACDGVFVLTS